MATIGIDATALCIPASRGIGTSQYRTMRALAESGSDHRFVLYAPSPPLVPYSGEPLDLHWPLRTGRRPAIAGNILWMQTGVNRLLAADGIELFWSPRHLLPFRAHGPAKVVTIHDYWHRYYPEQQPRLNRMADRILIDRAVRQADLVVTPSASTARDVVRLSGGSPERVRVVPWGVDLEVFKRLPDPAMGAVLRRLGVSQPFLLSLDVANPRKNFAAMLRAVSDLSEELRGSLTLVGLGAAAATQAGARVAAQATALDLGERVRLLGEVPVGDLAALYSGALALTYPSLYEGFGMPVLEAMACGCPVIAAARSSLPEVAGDAALLVDPGDHQGFGRAIASVAGDPAVRARLETAGRARAQLFTWKATAQGMLAAFDEVLARQAAARGGAARRGGAGGGDRAAQRNGAA